MRYSSVKGMEDILPQDIQAWQELERIARTFLESSGYREIRTPVVEETAVFTRSIGETTDIVSKEMYTFGDRKGRSLTLRPEGTAPVVRAYIEHSLHSLSPDAQLYYIGPMFRAERPQKGRSRQFHQIGVEMIGSDDPCDDAKIIFHLVRLLQLFGIGDPVVKLNSLGCVADKDNFSKELKGYLEERKKDLCEDCTARIEKNVLRVLDCKSEGCRKVIEAAPRMGESLCPDCVLKFATVKSILTYLNVNFTESGNLVRGLDYYTGTVFEVIHPNLGAQDALGAGGRYDKLVKDMGGPSVGALGFALGIERVLIALGEKREALKPSRVYFIPLGEEAKKHCLSLADEIRTKANSDPCRVKTIALVGSSQASLKSQMRNADKNEAAFVVIIGETELKQGEAAVKDMVTKEQTSVKFTDMIKVLEEKLLAKGV